MAYFCSAAVVVCVCLVPEASPSSARQVSSACGRAGDGPDAAAACYPNNLIFSSYDKPKLVKCPDSEGRCYRRTETAYLHVRGRSHSKALALFLVEATDVLSDENQNKRRSRWRAKDFPEDVVTEKICKQNARRNEQGCHVMPCCSLGGFTSHAAVLGISFCE